MSAGNPACCNIVGGHRPPLQFKLRSLTNRLTGCTLPATEADMAISKAISALIVLFSTVIVTHAQWLHYPTPGIPRTPDGKPNLADPAPKTVDGKPDLSGIWAGVDINLQNLAAEGGGAPMQPWAAALYQERVESLGKDRPSGRCLPHGVTDYDALGFIWKL